MRIRSLIIAAAALTFTAAVPAEPPKRDSVDSAKPTNRPVEVVFASAEQVRAPAQTAQEQTAAPVKKRTGRVTTCRCGNQTQQ
jgi:hypothetical protein